MRSTAPWAAPSRDLPSDPDPDVLRTRGPGLRFPSNPTRAPAAMPAAPHTLEVIPMIRRTRIGAGALLLVLAWAIAPTHAEETATATAAPDFTLKDVNGTDHKLSDYRGKWVVLEWMNYDCPFVKKHYDESVKNMQTLQAHYAQKDVVWLSICSSGEGKQGHMTPDQGKERLAERGAKPTALLLDPSGDVGLLYEAKVTPEIRIIDPDGNIAYTGAVDSVRSKDPADIEGATCYISQVLDAGLAGEEIPVAETRAYG